MNNTDLLKFRENRRKVCRDKLRLFLAGPDGDMMRDYLDELLELERIKAKSPLDTYYNLGKAQALKVIFEEARDE